jgi:hypothetical protein
MKIDNLKRANRHGVFFSLLASLIILMLAAFFFVEALQTEMRFFWGLVMIGVIVMYVFWFGGYDYVMMTLTPSTIEIKYYSLIPIGREYRVIRLKTDEVDHVVLRKGFLGVGNSLIIFQKSAKGLAKYPRVGLNAFSMEDKARISDFFRHKVR